MQNSFPSWSAIVTPPLGPGSLARLPSERHDLADCLIDVGNAEVQVKSVLHDLSFGDLLQHEDCRRAERTDGKPSAFTPERAGNFSDQRAPKGCPRWRPTCAKYPPTKTGMAAGQWWSSQSPTWETGEIMPISFGAGDSRPSTFTGWAGGVARHGSPGA